MRLSVFITSLCLVFAFASLSSCKKEKTKTSENTFVPTFKKEGTLQIKKAASDSITKTLAIEIADNDYEIQTGLMYRNTLKTNQGMLFILEEETFQNFYMKNTKIPLDIIYIAANKTIVSFQKNAKPMDETSLPSEAPTKYVLEINAGLSDAWQLDVGDVISFKALK